MDSFAFDFTAKYVRREIRKLAEVDRSNFFDALKTMYETSQSDGESQYGQKFRSIPTLVEEHLRGAADRACDHWHDDAGIMTHHMAFTLQMEQSLQSINAQVSMPYWDYTEDAYEYSSDWTESPVFADEWFGAIESNDPDHIITTGRWAYQNVVQSEGTDSRTRNPYGLVRSPWNTNPVPYILRSRHTLGVKDAGWTLPTCSDFATAFQETSLGEIFSMLNGKLHGPVHIMIGGQWFYNQSYDIQTGLDVAGTTDMVTDFLLTSKFLWRQGYIRCPEVCSSDTPQSKCRCSCPAEIINGRSAAEVLGDAGVPNVNLWYGDAFKLGSGMSDDEVLDLLCSVGHPGEMFSSAAPYDPLFWPLHGLAERFLSLKILKTNSGVGSLNTSWDYSHVDYLASDTDLVCDWAGVHGMEMPKCTRGACPGHRASDLLPMGNFLGENETYTNKEFFHFMNPTNSDLPYVYDSFTKWKVRRDFVLHGTVVASLNCSLDSAGMHRAKYYHLGLHSRNNAGRSPTQRLGAGGSFGPRFP